MTVQKNKFVSLAYELRLESFDAEVYETATQEKPLEFVYGAGLMLPKFEEAIAGKTAGDKFQIEIDAKDGYGEVNPEAIIDLPRNIFEIEGKFDEELVKPGNTIPMMAADGRRMNGVVLELGDATVKMDFNHPLAGEDLYFKGEVIGVRDASDEELAAFLGGGCSSCGSQSSCSESSCGEGDSDCGDGSCGCGC